VVSRFQGTGERGKESKTDQPPNKRVVYKRELKRIL
jgi:hypothetical protein